MQPIHLICHCEAYKHMEIEMFKEYAKLECNEQSVAVKWQEEKDLADLIEKLYQAGLKDFKDYDDYYWGYTIERISKEFDLLRIGADYCINIELKHQSSKDKILKQLCLNQYYLKTLGNQIYYFTYVVDINTLYQLEDNQLKQRDLSDLIALIHQQKVKRIKNIDELFEPSKFLVSPLTQAQDFLDDRYFLTHQQLDFKNRILNKIATAQPQPMIISGMAGTGKTLLLYDIAKTVMAQYSVVIVHIGKLSEGQTYLQSKGYHICTLDKVSNYPDCHLLLMDETQRLSKQQIRAFITWAEKHHRFCLMAIDGYEMLQRKDDFYSKLTAPDCFFELSGHIRINSVLIQFISELFEPEKRYAIDFSDYVELFYFDNPDLAENWLIYSKKSGFDVINDYLSIAWKTEDVIGMEFEKVAVMIDSSFRIENGYVSADDSQVENLYIQLTRARQKIRLVIVGNIKFFQYCINILKK